jgi:hypothetical protein
MPDPPTSQCSPRLYALLLRLDGYQKLLKAGKIDLCEWFLLMDPFEHDGFPKLSPPHPDEVEFQKSFSSRLGLFFEHEAPGLSADRVQERLDELVKEALAKEYGMEKPWTLLQRRKT